jgi:hypothetical protein
MKMLIPKYAVRLLYSLSLLVYIFVSTGGMRSGIKLYGNVGQTDLTSFTQLSKDLGAGDASWHFKIANELLTQNSVAENSLWWLRSAPPGLGVTEGLILRIFGFDGFGLAYIFAISFFWTLAFILIIGLGKTWYDLVKRAILIALILQYTGFSQWMTGPGIFYTESLSTALMVIALGFLLRAKRSKDSSYGSMLLGLSGVFLASASFFRANFVYVTYFLLGIGFLKYCHLRIQGSRRKEIWLNNLNDSAIQQLLVGLGSIIALLPYYYMAKTYLLMPAGALNATGFHLQYAWINPEGNQFKTVGAGWLCQINNQYCQQEILSEYSVGQIIRQNLETLISYPFDVIRARIDVFARAWFSGEGPGATGNFDGVFQGVIILSLLVALFFICILSQNSQVKYEIKLAAVFLLACILPYLITHVEVRFLIPVKILVIFVSARTLLHFSGGTLHLELKRVNRLWEALSKFLRLKGSKNI